MRHAALILAVAAAACGGAEAGDLEAPDAAVVEAEAEVAPRPPAGEALGSFKLTYYWVTAEDAYPGPRTERIYSRKCEVLATVTPAYAKSLRLEGTGRLSDGRVLNAHAACDCPGATSTCFLEADEDHPWGYGVQSRALEPYRSVAVDRAVVPYGTRLWLAELDGVEVPGDPPWGGYVHDGCVVAADTGGSIDGQHLDWFVGLRTSYRTLDPVLQLTRATVHDGGERCP